MPKGKPTQPGYSKQLPGGEADMHAPKKAKAFGPTTFESAMPEDRSPEKSVNERVSQQLDQAQRPRRTGASGGGGQGG